MSFNLGDLTNIAAALELSDAQSIKASLPLAYVLQHYEVQMEVTEGGLRAFCPFHKDGQESNPSFTVFGDGLRRWSCWSCGKQGDVLDLIQTFEPGLAFLEAADRARELYTEMIDADWESPIDTERVTRKPPPDPETTASEVMKAQDSVKVEMLEELIAIKRKKDGPDSNRFDAQFLIEQFRVGTWGTWTIIPYYTTDDELATYKHRTPKTPPHSLPGARFEDLLYNGWRQDMLDAPVLLCEGESDTWNAQYEVGDTYRVLGIPTGAGSNLTKFLPEFKNKTVLLAFDTDPAGRAGIMKLSAKLHDAGANVRIVPIPEGKDISAVAANLRNLCKRARAIVAAPPGLRLTDTGYVRSNNEAASVVSNFIFRPARELQGADGVAYEGRLMPGGEEAILSSYDLSSKGRILGWAMRYGRTWYGSDRDASILLGMLQAEGVYLPAGQMATVAGLHDSHFVWPGGLIGPDYWKFVPPSANTNLEDDMFIRPGAWKPDYIHTLRAIHKRRVTDPILAWMAVAPLRSLFKEFPLLAISGPHGSGKTRTVEVINRGFTGTYIANTLTGSTPHAVLSAFAATNGFPVIFEEYRNGAREEAKIVFEQLARDAYTQQKSQKGGMKGNWAELTSIVPSAPVIVSGEDMFSEGSHVERMIMIQMFRQGQNAEAFARASAWRNNGLPYAYLTWLHRSLQDGTIDAQQVEPSGPADLAQRQRINIGVISLGWRLLQMFMEDAEDGLDEPDFSMVIGELRDANGHTPIEDAIHWCLGELDASAIVFLKGANVYVKVDNFVKFINDSRVFQLPGKAASIKAYLKSTFQAKEELETVGTLRQTYMVFPFEKIAR